ncbi:MAG TPA: hypothetical protein VGP24_04155 [Glaciihabitans sp.]|jgi:uncharacterized protein with PQ loop repeat|nr:hypothetical protein [Glaciihabitans sp.]
MFTTAFFINALGFTATLFAILMWIPQARITWQNRNDAVRLAGVSETTQWLSVGSYLLWGVFGILSQSFWVAAPSMISLPLSIATIVVIRRGRTLAPLTVSTEIIGASDEFAVGTVTGPQTAPVPILASESVTTESIPVISANTGAVATAHPVAAPVPILV